MIKIAKIRMSTKAMSAFMYATIMTDARILVTWGLGIKDYTRKQNTYHHCDIKLAIDEDKVEQFETLAECKLTDGVSVTIQ